MITPQEHVARRHNLFLAEIGKSWSGMFGESPCIKTCPAGGIDSLLGDLVHIIS